VAQSTDNGATFNLKWSPAGRGFSGLVETAGGGIVVVGESGAGPLDLSTLTTR
jgi:hypothetical protein